MRCTIIDTLFYYKCTVALTINCDCLKCHEFDPLIRHPKFQRRECDVVSPVTDPHRWRRGWNDLPSYNMASIIRVMDRV